jgi:energy-coupling factor transport system permease protein
VTTSSTVESPRRTPFNARWRVVDIVIASVIAVASGFIFWGWNQTSTARDAVDALLPGFQGLFNGGWLFAGVLAALIIRKPGAALYAETVAATISALLGAQWGPLTIESGIVQGLAAELVFLAFLYSNWRIYVAILAGAAAGLACAVNDLILWYAGAASEFATIYIISSTISGAVIAGVLPWLLVRALAATGALDAFASGRERRVEV